MIERPAPPTFELSPGFEWRVDEDRDWTLEPAVLEGFQCRQGGWRGRRRCPNAAVAALLRPTMRYSEPMDLSGRRRVPWRYCAEHMYGRWIESGRVFMWVARSIGS